MTALTVLLLAAWPDASGPSRPRRVEIEFGPGVRAVFLRVPVGRGLWIQATETTQAQWRAVTGTDPSKFKGEGHPVDSVTWTEAVAFAETLTERFGRRWTFDLPTEAEWEAACRAGSTTAWCFGDDEARLDEYAWYGKRGGSTSHPVGSKKPNTWGLHDMHGNVLEWCKDPWDDKGDDRVIRGGGWYGVANLTASSRRWHYGKDYKGYMNGFRLVLR